MGLPFFSSAQRRCGTVEYMQKLKAQNFIHEGNDQFEKWIKTKKANRLSFRQKSGKYRIPVVVHVIHNGEPVGQGANVSVDQILSQLRVLNEDFQRKNADTLDTPLEFSEVASGMDIEFVLAKRSPAGFPTSGIVRVNGGRDEWFSGNDIELKSLSYWPAEEYLNIWVCNLVDFLGYAEFPVSTLPGLEDSDDNRLTDGLVVWHKSFGSIDDGNFDLDERYNKGRTATHEIAHFLGLRHIWGDQSGCTGTDYVDDTPVHDDESKGCPSHPSTACEPVVTKMFQNFTDYTDDRCMNMFTKGQVERMEIVLENSPRRASLLTSQGLNPPDVVDNDLGLAKIVSPFPVQCDNEIIPTIEIENRGKNTITSAAISLAVNSQIAQTNNIALNLLPEENTTITFAPINVEEGNSSLVFEVTSVNGTSDGNDQDNVKTFNILIDQQHDLLPLRQTFEDSVRNWSVVNPASGMVWQTVSTNYKTSIYFNSFRNLKVEDESWLVSPTLDFSNIIHPSLVFDLSAAKRSSFDDLKILISTDCGAMYQPLAYSLPDSFKPSASNWVPANESDWAVGQYISLEEFAGEENVRIAFVVKNASGNNVYLDNIEFFVNNDPREITVEDNYTIYGYTSDRINGRELKIGFNLETRQDVRIEVSDLTGRVVGTGDYKNVLNQVFDLPVNDYMKAGLYLVRFRIDGKQYASRIVLRD